MKFTGNIFLLVVLAVHYTDDNRGISWSRLFGGPGEKVAWRVLDIR